MEADQAISFVSDFVRSRGLDYPTDGLQAERFEAGWSVYAPLNADDTEAMSAVDIPVGVSLFLVADSGRIEEVPTSIPPQRAREQFIAREAAAAATSDESGETEFMAELERHFSQLSAEGPQVISDFTIVDSPHPDDPGGPHSLNLGNEAHVAEEASRLIEPIVQQLAQLGPHGWQGFSAVFAFTVSAEVAQLRFWSDQGSGLVPVPTSIAALVREQRDVAAGMPAGPWWRLLLTVTNRGEMAVDYDYGDEPFPDDQLMAPEDYRNDLDTYPRPGLPVWLAGYVAGPVQRRDASAAAAKFAADADAGRNATATQDIPPLPELWARWAVLSAAYVGVKSDWGPRIFPGYAWYENDQRSGSTLYLLPGERAVLSGGLWNSPLLEAAYNRDQPLPALYTGAPAWVNDTVLNTRNRNGLLSFCYWWCDGRWYCGFTGAAEELSQPIPAVWTPEDTVQAMLRQTGSETQEPSRALLVAADHRTATPDDVAAVFADHPDADIDAAVNQLSIAGVLGD